MRGNKGITLVTLMVTITIMLMLVLVTVRMVIDEDLFEETSDTVDKASTIVEKDNIKTNVLLNEWDRLLENNS